MMNEKTILSYQNFENLSQVVLDLAKSIMPDKVIYINFLNNDVQITMKVSKHDTKVKVGEGVTIPVDEAICNRIDYKKGIPLVLEDIKHNDFDDKVNQTIKDLNIGAYLGIPISYKDGQRFGTLCAAHHDQRKFDTKDIVLLQNVAKLFSYYLDLEDVAFKDNLTGLYNKHFLGKQDFVSSYGIMIMLDLDGFKQVNDQLGHQAGDDILKEVGQKLMSQIRPFKNSFACRLGGDEFLIYMKTSLQEKELKHLLENILESLNHYQTELNDVKLSASIGAYVYKYSDHHTLKGLLKITDDLLYQAKKTGKNKYIIQHESMSL